MASTETPMEHLLRLLSVPVAHMLPKTPSSDWVYFRFADSATGGHTRASLPMTSRMSLCPPSVLKILKNSKPSVNRVLLTQSIVLLFCVSN